MLAINYSINGLKLIAQLKKTKTKKTKQKKKKESELELELKIFKLILFQENRHH